MRAQSKLTAEDKLVEVHTSILPQPNWLLVVIKPSMLVQVAAF